MKDKYILGIDIGTSGCKSIITDTKGNIVSSALTEYPLYSPQVGWYEQNPEDWWNAVVKGIKMVLKESRIDPKQLAGIGLSGHNGKPSDILQQH